MNTVESISEMYVAATMAEKLSMAEKALKDVLDYDKEHPLLGRSHRLKVGGALENVLSTRAALDSEIAECIEAYQ